MIPSVKEDLKQYLREKFIPKENLMGLMKRFFNIFKKEQKKTLRNFPCFANFYGPRFLLLDPMYKYDVKEKLTFNDVAGIDEAKIELSEV